MAGRTVKLKYPITVEGREIDVLVFPERIKFRQLRAADEGEGDIEKAGLLLGSLCNIPRSSVDQIDLEDFPAILEALAPFFEMFPSDGGSLPRE